MANELKITLGISYANGALSDAVAPSVLSVNQAALGFQGDATTVSSAGEADLSTSNIATLGWIYMKNVDPTNFVQWGPKSGGSMVVVGRLMPGESAVLRLEPGITLRWIADTADVKVLTKLYND